MSFVMGGINSSNHSQFNYHTGKANTRELLYDHDVTASKLHAGEFAVENITANHTRMYSWLSSGNVLFYTPYLNINCDESLS